MKIPKRTLIPRIKVDRDQTKAGQGKLAAPGDFAAGALPAGGCFQSSSTETPSWRDAPAPMGPGPSELDGSAAALLGRGAPFGPVPEPRALEMKQTHQRRMRYVHLRGWFPVRQQQQNRR